MNMDQRCVDHSLAHPNRPDSVKRIRGAKLKLLSIQSNIKTVIIFTRGTVIICKILFRHKSHMILKYGINLFNKKDAYDYGR